MSNALPIEDLSKTYLEHSMVINNFVIKIGSQINDSLCRVFGDGVQYEWRENDDKVIIPDVSIICNLRDRKNISFTGIPRFVMEVLSNATEEYDRHYGSQSTRFGRPRCRHGRRVPDPARACRRARCRSIGFACDGRCRYSRTRATGRTDR